MSTTSLPVLALPYPTVLLPGSTLSLPLSRHHVDALAAHLAPDDAQPLLAAVPSLAEGSSSLHTHGVSARATQLVRRTGTQTFVLTLHAIQRVRVNLPPLSASGQDLVPLAPVSFIPSSTDSATTTPPPAETVHAFKAAALRLLDRLAHDNAQSARRRDGWARLATLVENAEDARAASVADVLVGMVGIEHAEKLHILTLEPAALLTHVTALLTKHSTSLGIVQSLTSSLDRQQREHFLRQQLAAVRAELDALQPGGTGGANAANNDLDAPADADDPDGLADLRKKIEVLAPGSRERGVAAVEWKRLKRIPNASAEWGVVRNYLDWLTALPWPTSSPAPSTSTSTSHEPTSKFLARARAQLDADHYGLDRVKRRLIEYLAVVRLLEGQAQAQTDKAEAQAGMKAKAVEGVSEEKALVLRKDVPSPTPTPAPAPRPKKRVARGPILLFVGPPGTGKTSLGASVARALGRPFERVALGGVRDEGEVRGHRRTYVGAGPGVFVQALKRAGRVDPVILLDEVDKIGHNNFQGDPGAALLEVLDPEQNHAFTDHYLNVPVDLSQVLFICTANTLETIAPPLLDRCEIVQLSGYTAAEKTHIARRFLLPKQLERNGLPAVQLALDDEVLDQLVTRYTREAGVRSLERAVAGVVRYKAVQWAESVESTTSASASTAPIDAGRAVVKAKEAYTPVVTVSDLETILGVARWDPAEEREREPRAGVVYGLVVTGLGEGEVMPVETIAVPGRGRIKLTGSLGEVIKESGELALSWVKTHAHELGITSSPAHDPLAVREIDVHLHLPAGAQKKDGPSAGVAITCAFVSLLTGLTVSPDIAMTGEITLRGRVTPVGGVKEKVLGAHRAGARKVILPWANRKDVSHDVPVEVRDRMEFAFVRTVREALDAAFGVGVLGWRERVELVQSRL